jgi:hypothetical protein
MTRFSFTTLVIAGACGGSTAAFAQAPVPEHEPTHDTVVSSRNYDPRVGETTYQLVNVARTEQAPDLFAVPQGYTLLPEARPEFGAFGSDAPGVRVERGVAVGTGRN